MARRQPPSSDESIGTESASKLLLQDMDGFVYYDTENTMFILAVHHFDQTELYESPTVRPEGRAPDRVIDRHVFVSEVGSQYVEVSLPAKEEPVARREQIERYMATGEITTPLTGKNLADYKWCKRMTKLNEH